MEVLPVPAGPTRSNPVGTGTLSLSASRASISRIRFRRSRSTAAGRTRSPQSTAFTSGRSWPPLSSNARCKVSHFNSTILKGGNRRCLIDQTAEFRSAPAWRTLCKGVDRERRPQPLGELGGKDLSPRGFVGEIHANLLVEPHIPHQRLIQPVIEVRRGHENEPGGSAILIDALHQFGDHRVVEPGASPDIVVSAQLLALGAYRIDLVEEEQHRAVCIGPRKCLPNVRLTIADPALNETGRLRVPVVDLELARRRLGQEGLARSARSVQKNAVLNHPVLFESLGVKPVLHDRADAALLIVHTADVSKCPRRDVRPSGLLVRSVASSPCGSLYGTDIWSMADYEDQTANSHSPQK